MRTIQEKIELNAILPRAHIAAQNIYLNKCAEKQADIENHVQYMADRIESGEVKAQAHHTFATEIRYHLWIKGYSPGHEINPANRGRQLNVEVGIGDNHSDEQFGNTEK